VLYHARCVANVDVRFLAVCQNVEILICVRGREFVRGSQVNYRQETVGTWKPT